MCGIIGFARRTEAVEVLLDGLERLEYRGYDSAGVALATYAPLVEKSLSNIVEVKSRGAEVIAMTTERTATIINSQASEMFVIPEVHPILQPVLGVIPLQLFAYYIALNRGCDIDKPRNLAKSVTVE